MTDLTRHDIVTSLGSVDDIVVSEIQAMGASPEEFAQARAWLINDEAMMNAGDRLASAGRIARLIEIIAAAEESVPEEPPR